MHVKDASIVYIAKKKVFLNFNNCNVWYITIINCLYLFYSQLTLYINMYNVNWELKRNFIHLLNHKTILNIANLVTMTSFHEVAKWFNFKAIGKGEIFYVSLHFKKWTLHGQIKRFEF